MPATPTLISKQAKESHSTVTNSTSVAKTDPAKLVQKRNRNMIIGGLALAGAALVAHNLGAFEEVSKLWNEGKRDLF